VDPGSGTSVPAVIVHAERAGGKVLLGLPPLSGGNMLATLEEFRLADDVAALAHEPS
jgi:hypothetical protein